MLKTSAFAAITSCLLFAACGGGGGGGGSGSSSSGGSSSSSGGSSSSSSSSSSGGGTANTITLSVSRVDLFFDDVSGAGYTAEVTATFSGAGVAVGTLPGETLPSWLIVFNPTVVNPTTARVQINFSPSTSTPQRFSTTLRFATADANGTNVVFRDLPVTATVNHTLSRYSAHLLHTRGALTSPSLPVEVQTNNATWVATSDAPWLQVSPASGTGTATLNVTTTPGALAEGDFAGTINVRDTVTNYTRALRVNLGVDPRRLEVSQRAMAFSVTTLGSVLSHTTRVIDTAGINGRWIATAGSPWLHVSPSSGSGNAVLTITADPAGVANGAHYGNITVAPDNEPGLANTEIIRTGFYIDRTSPVATNTDIGLLNGGPKFVSPLMPYMYKVDSGFPDSSIEVWNMYTATRIGAPVPLPGVTTFRACQSSDGTRIILVIDGPNRRLQNLNVDGTTVTVGTAWTSMRADPLMKDCDITRVSGRNVVLWGNAQVLSYDDGTLLADFISARSGLTHSLTLDTGVGTSPDGRLGFLTVRSLGNHLVYRVQLGNRGGAVTASVTDEIQQTSGGVDTWFSPLSDYAYHMTTEGSAIRRFPVAALTPDLTIPLPFRADSLLVMPNGHLYVPAEDQWVHLDGDLRVLGTRDIITDGVSGVISSDGRRMFEVRSGAAQAWGVFSNVDF